MANCKLTKSLDNKECDYSVSGARALYLLNFYGANVVTEAPAQPVANMITYVMNTDGYITQIIPPAGEFFYKLESAAGTISATDALQVGGNGGKYRLHTVNAVINQMDLDVIEQMDALSLGRFVAVVVDNSGRVRVYGRTGGLTAPADGANDNTGAAAADATGLTLILAGEQTETLKLMINEAAITPIQEDEVIPPVIP